ncbi:transcriptional regulator [Jiangella ureilytica]|uniref:Transcriptional regulator n=1 Tax=Jiangella ureilytica TaxID=2530374 RepID=A0A4R4RC78_9ACTN|nr:transcriptional regulator [Jiangella ureilytica]
MTVELGVDELADTRFAVSPLSETVAALQQLAGQDRQAVHRRWLQWAQDELAHEPLALPLTWPLLFGDTRGWPEFLVPAPTGPGGSIDDDLAALRRTPASTVRANLRRRFGDTAPSAAVADLAADPEHGLRELAAELRAAHDRLIAPHWPRISAVLAADVAHRTRQLARGGAAALFADLHPDLRWHDGRLELGGDRWRQDRAVDRGPGGLVLMPVVLGSAYVLIKRRTSTQTTVRYPARGVGELWSVLLGRSPAGATVRLLGRARAELLATLRSPATTTDLARALGVTPSAVAQHLRVLRENGLVAGERNGRSVLYRTTALGAALHDGSGAPLAPVDEAEPGAAPVESSACP